MNRKRLTRAVAQFPEVTVYEFEPKLKQLRPLRRASLSEADINLFAQKADDQRQRVSPSPEPSPALEPASKPDESPFVVG